MSALIDLTGQTFGRLVVLNRAGEWRRPSGAAGAPTWRCLCSCGAETTVASGSLRKGTTSSCGCLHREQLAARNARDVPKYCGAHVRLRQARGNADQHPCVECGEPARDWAYDHSDPDELTGYKGFAYSLDPNHYQPLCRNCHNIRDHQAADHRRLAKGRTTARLL